MLAERQRTRSTKQLHEKLEFMFFLIRENLGAASAAGKTLLILCLVAGVSCRADAAGNSSRHMPVSSQGSSSNFTIADFDGDQKPDLATVEIQKSSSSRTTRYSIRFQLTAGIAQVFGVTAPSGGLQIVARDVNGDNTLDVLVTTVLQHEQVAVLLNDGHGKFRLADASEFPAALRENSRRWNSGAIPLCDSSALVRVEYPAGELDRESKFDDPQSYFVRTRTAVRQRSIRVSLFSLLGRAPPAFILQS
jgi:hypothetical protein